MEDFFSFKYPFLYFGNLGIKVSMMLLFVYILCYLHSIFSVNIGQRYIEIREKHRLYLSCMLILSVVAIVVQSNNGNFLKGVADRFLEAELLLDLGMIVAVLYASVFVTNRHKYLTLLNDFFSILLYLSMISVIISKQINIFRNNNGISFFILSIILIISQCWEIKIRKVDNLKGPVFDPIETYSAIYDTRKHQAEELIRLIEDADIGKLSVCLSGNWGVGKTSFVNGVIDKIKSSEKYDYDVIRINALEIDSIDSLFKLFFDQIKSILVRRRTYVGIASEYEEFLSSAAGIVTNEKYGVFLKQRLFHSKNDYRASKSTLGELISDALGRDKVIVVIDDIERCSPDKAKEFIFFVKEVATMEKCISIFLVDKSILTSTIFNNKTEENELFLDKFFNHIVNLECVPYEISLKQFEKENHVNLKHYTIGAISAYESYIKNESKYTEKIREAQNKFSKLSADYKKKDELNKEIESLNKLVQKLRKNVENPRKMIKCSIIMNGYIKQLNKMLADVDPDESGKITQFYEKNKSD